MTKFNVIRKGGIAATRNRAKQFGYWDPENDAAIIKTFESEEAAQEYAEACNSLWTEGSTEYPVYNPEYRVVPAKIYHDGH